MGVRLLLFVTLLLVPRTSSADRARILVCAASSLGPPLAEIVDLFTTQEPAARIDLHLAGSTALRRQIESGAPCDVFVAAGTEDAATLRAQGRLDTLTILTGNRLVVVTRRDGVRLDAFADLLSPQLRRIAVGAAAMAPIGRSTAQALTASGLAAALQAKLVPFEDAAQVTAAVASGNADAGIAYRTDARREVRVQEGFTIPESLHAPIVYTIAPLRRTADPAAATRVVALACGPVGGEVLQRHGFAVAASARPTHAGSPTSELPRRAAPQALVMPLSPVMLSLRVALLATVIVTALGLALAAALANARAAHLRNVAAALVDLPMVLPPTVVGVVLLEVVAPQRPLGALLERAGMRIAFTWGAAVIAAAVMALPLMVRPARSALEAVPRRYVQAARCLGAGPWRVFWRVQLPLARRGVASGIILAFFRALGEFGATLIVAGNIPGRTQTLPLAIYSAVFAGRTSEALVWVLGVGALGFAGALLAQRLAGSTAP